MTIVRPDDLAGFVGALDVQQWDDLRTFARGGLVDLRLPRWAAGTAADLGPS